jgi:two-component system LytT family response regulator
MRKLRVILVDDERLAREEIKRHLDDYPTVDLCGEAEDIDQASALIQAHQPDLLLLDVQMPGGSGFELLESLQRVPEVIFVTAFDQYAVKAFEANALDYLVKPVRVERFAKAMEKIMDRFNEMQTQEGLQEQKIFVKEGDRIYFVNVLDIYRIESSGNYARIYTNNNKLLVKKSLNQLEKTLDPSLFFRINRNEIIQLQFVQYVETLPKSRLLVRMQSGTELIVSGRQSVAFRNLHFRNNHI